MIEIIRTNSTNIHFQALVKMLDQELAVLDGDDHAFYDQFNKTDNINYVVIALEEGKPVGCGAIKEYSPSVMEIKRMYVLPDSRGKKNCCEHFNRA